MPKFDAAISLLEGAGFAIRGHAKDRDKALAQCREMAHACMVLAAAEKVDERDLGRVFMGFVSSEMRSLLEAIKSPPPTDAPKEAPDGSR
jgi:hypothetical protein